jgi:anti-sigma B factor antagonist
VIFTIPDGTNTVSVDLTEGSDLTVAAVSGELDSGVAGFLRRHFVEALAAGPPALLLDFAAAGFCSAAVLRVLTEVTGAADSAGVAWAFVSDQRAVLRSLVLAGLDETLHPLPTVAAARSWLALATAAV